MNSSKARPRNQNSFLNNNSQEELKLTRIGLLPNCWACADFEASCPALRVPIARDDKVGAV